MSREESIGGFDGFIILRKESTSLDARRILVLCVIDVRV